MIRLVAAAGAALVACALATPAIAGETGWSKDPSPNPAAPAGQLFGVSCSGASACTAVGTYVKPSGRGVTLAERWNGKKWSIQPTPNPLVRRSVRSPASPARRPRPASPWGIHHWLGVQVTLAERWNGTTWRDPAHPNPAGAQGSFLNGVSCASLSACTAVGVFVNSSGVPVTLAERWNGTTWRIQRSPNPAGARAVS
jgi:hypothetical protein